MIELEKAYDFYFVGGIFSTKLENTLLRKNKCNLQYAADNLQKSFILGLSEYINNLCVISLPFISSFSHKCKIFRLRKDVFKYKNSQTTQLSFVNFPGLKIFSKIYSLYFHLCSLKRERKEKFFFVYSLHSPLLIPLFLYKRKNKKTRICVIVPDLPQYMSSNRIYIYKFLKKIDRLLINKCLFVVDYYVLISKHMGAMLPIRSHPFVTIEGIYNYIDNRESIITERKNTIVYSGSLSEKYGIIDLIEAFLLIPQKDYKLIICGNGDKQIEDKILKIQKEDERIEYLGILPHKDVIELQRKARLLVNPRMGEEEFTRYSFPSKTIEYFVSGTPTLLFKLPGIPEEYYEYCFSLESCSVMEFSEKIQSIISLTEDELNNIGRKAKEFILSKKSPKVQCKKIIDLITEYEPIYK